MKKFSHSILILLLFSSAAPNSDVALETLILTSFLEDTKITKRPVAPSLIACKGYEKSLIKPPIEKYFVAKLFAFIHTMLKKNGSHFHADLST